jgi:hypothetical protein
MPLVDITLEKKAPEVNMFMPTAIYQKIRTPPRSGMSP